jgi:signal transduction histidine kinase
MSSAPLRLQIRTRLTVQFICITAGIFAGALFFIYLRFQRYSEEEFYMILENKARITANMVLSHESELVAFPPVGVAPGRLSVPYTENIALYDAADRRMFATNSSAPVARPAALAVIRRERERYFKNAGFQVYASVVTGRSGREYVVISEGRFDSDKLRQLRTIMIFSFLVTISAVAAGGFFFAGQALRPVKRIVEEVEGILPTDLSRRLPAAGLRDELSQLVDTFNRMLDRIEQAFRLQKSFISNVSHEIRNPLAAMDAQLQFARQRERPAADYRRVLESLHDDVHYITGMADKLLELAKLHSGPANIAFAPLRLDELLLHVRAALLRANPGYGVSLDFHELPVEEEALEVLGNEPLLRTALYNLFENGCKYAPDHRVACIAHFDSAAGHTLEIRDNGPGIPAEELTRIFEPFFRGARHTGIKGSGVGLSLVQSIVQLHGIALSVESDEDQGTVFRLRFAAEPTSRPQLAAALPSGAPV